MSALARSALHAALALSLTAGAVMTAWGLARLDWPADLPLHNGWVRAAASLLGVIFLMRYVLRRLRVSPTAVITVFVVVCGLASANAAALVACMVTFISWCVLGRVVTRLIGRGDNAQVTLVENMLAGAGVLGTLIAFTAAWDVHYPWTYVLLLVTPLVLARRETRAVCVQVWAALSKKEESDTHGSSWLAAAIASVALIYLAVAFMPEIGHDALGMHLFVIHQLASSHAWSYDAQTYVWAVMPMLGDWVFAMPYMLGAEAAARLANVGFIFANAVLVRAIVLWAGGAERGAQWAALLFLSMPLTFTEGSSLFIESVWASFVMASLLALARACTGSGALAMVRSAMFAGFALASKAVTLTLLPVLVFGAVLFWRRWARVGLGQTLAAGGLVFAIAGLFPYVNAWWRTQNPVFPFFNSIFQSPFFPPENFESASVFGKGVSWDLPYRMAFDSGRYLEATVGAGGFHWLLVVIPALLALFACGNRRALLLAAFALAALVLAFNSVSYLRYIFPSLVILTAVAGVAIATAGGERTLMTTALPWMAAIATVLNMLFLGSGSAYRDLKLSILFQPERRLEWLQARAPIRQAVDAVNSVNTGRTPVTILVRSNGLGATLDADAFMPTWYNGTFASKVAASREPGQLAAVLAAEGIEYIILGRDWPQAQRLAVESASELISTHGDLSVRRLSRTFRYQQELIEEPDFGSTNAWSMPDGVATGAGAVTVTVSAPAFQTVNVVPGRRYLQTVQVQCLAGPAPARIQVNWMDASGVFIKADIRVIECSSELTTDSMEVTAPKRARRANVYASAHTDRPVTFSRISFKR